MGKIPVENPIDGNNIGQNYKLCCDKSMGTEQVAQFGSPTLSHVPNLVVIT